MKGGVRARKFSLPMAHMSRPRMRKCCSTTPSSENSLMAQLSQRDTSASDHKRGSAMLVLLLLLVFVGLKQNNNKTKEKQNKIRIAIQIKRHEHEHEHAQGQMHSHTKTLCRERAQTAVD